MQRVLSSWPSVLLFGTVYTKLGEYMMQHTCLNITKFFGDTVSFDPFFADNGMSTETGLTGPVPS